jgi:phosphoribosylformylglycinamidine (FGAM) synthase-like enzyme
LFAETNGCLLVEVDPENTQNFEANFKDLPAHLIGEVIPEDKVSLIHSRSEIVNLPMSELVAAFKATLNG